MVKFWTNTKELLEGKRLRFIFEPGFEALTPLLADDVVDTSERYLERLEEALNGTVDYAEITGNIYTLEITKEQTKVCARLEKGSDADCYHCVIETSELKKVLKVWGNEFDKFYR